MVFKLIEVSYRTIQTDIVRYGIRMRHFVQNGATCRQSLSPLCTQLVLRGGKGHKSKKSKIDLPDMPTQVKESFSLSDVTEK